MNLTLISRFSSQKLISKKKSSPEKRFVKISKQVRVPSPSRFRVRIPVPESIPSLILRIITLTFMEEASQEPK